MKNTMKKLLCMALAIMLLISVVPVFAMASQDNGATTQEDIENVGVGTVDYAVVFAVWNDTDQRAVFSDPIAYARVAANAENVAIRNAVMNALAERGYNSVSENDIVREVQKKDSNIVHAVDFISTNETLDTNGKQYRFVLNVKDTPKDTREDVERDATVWLDRNNTKSYVKTNAKVKVTLVKCTTGNSAPTYTMKSNGGASAEVIRAALGAEFNNKTLAITMDGPSASGEVNYYVSVTGTSGSTGTNVPSHDGTTNPDSNRIPVNGDSTSNGGSGSNNGGSSSNNSGSSNTNNGTSQNLGNGGTGIVNGSNTDRNRFPYDVVLHIYQNNKVDEPVKNIVINDSLAADGTVSLSEVKTEVMKYFSAKTSAGIGYAGLYYARGNWVKDYATYNGEYDAITGIDSMRQVSQVDINVMITNATAKTTSTAKADSSNPKTGDTIFVPVMVMGLTASALAAAYVFGKKRIAR